MFRTFVIALLFAATATSVASLECGQGQESVSVEGIGDFCAVSPTCSGSDPTGNCAGITDGLPYGSYCGIVASGVRGCVANTSTGASGGTTTSTGTGATGTVATGTGASGTTTTTSVSGAGCSADQYEMSVEGVNHVFCVSGVACSGDAANGAPVGAVCPGQDAVFLPLGSTCGIVSSGVYGCKRTMPTNNGAGATAASSVKTDAGCAPFEAEMSVEGVDQVFCISGAGCSGDPASGNAPSGVCPGVDAQFLPFGSSCSVVSSGVYGCKPNADPAGASASASTTTSTTTTTSTSSNTAPVVDPFCVGNPGGDTQVSVATVGTYCARSPVCSGTIFGNCPGADSGLAIPVRCDFVGPNVYGCVV